MKNVPRLKELITMLNKASEAYYLYDNPIMSDKQYDDLMDELESLEKETGIIMSNSPLHKVQGGLLPGLSKVAHTKPMLSAQKTKDMADVVKFIAKAKTVQSWKLDGLTIVVRYEKGIFKQAITRGSGDIGEDVTEAFRHCLNLPMVLPEDVNIEVRGECVISWENFNKINEGLTNKYSHPRNLAAGSVRQLDTRLVKDRCIEYVVFELIEVDDSYMDVAASFEYLKKLGFSVVEHHEVNASNYAEVDVEFFSPDNYRYPVDGVIYKYDSYELGEALGITSHHPLNMLARKFKDEEYETILTDIEWSLGKTGILTPVAVFNPVEIDGTIVERASLHNLSIMLELGIKCIGQKVNVYKANMIIPQISSAEVIPLDIRQYLKDGIEYDGRFLKDFEIPKTCPVCGAKINSKHNDNDVVLLCPNVDCKGKLLGRLCQFVSKNGANIEGLSEATLEFLMSRGWVNRFVDLYHLSDGKIYTRWTTTPGYGKKSVDKILESIEKSRDITLENFLYAQCIPLVGRSASKDIAKFCGGDIDKFCELMVNAGPYTFRQINGFGDAICGSLWDWYETEWISFLELSCKFRFKTARGNQSISSIVNGKNFCITGKLVHYPNRDALVTAIESAGGKVVSGVTKKTDYLITNDPRSGSSKNKKAAECGTKIITESEFIEMIK